MLGEINLKLLFFTDTHIRGNSPKNRKDDFLLSLENKFKEINSLVKELDIDFVIHGGDLFDRPDISISVVSRFTNILKKIKVPIYIVSGNHDIFGHNPQTLDRTMLGLLNSLDFINVISESDNVFLNKDDVMVQITGVPYSYNIDDSPAKYILKEVNPDANFSIHIVHGMLLDRPFIKGIPYTLVDDIINTRADITLTGHYHAGFKTIEREGKYFVNPGSLVRVTNSMKEIERTPQVCLIELTDKISVKMIPLKSALPGEDVLDRSELEKSSFKSERILEFKQSIDSALNFEKMDINDLLIEVAFSENVDDKVKQEALKRITLVQMKE